MKSTPSRRAKRRSSSSLSDSAGTLTATPGRDRPLLLDTSPPSTTRQTTSGALDADDGERELAVVDEQPVARRGRRRPGSCRWWRPARRCPATSSTVMETWLPVAQTTGPSANVPSRIFGPCRSASTATAWPVLSDASRTSRRRWRGARARRG